MIDKVIENNRVSIIGEIVSEFRFSHEVFGEGFYIVDISVDRLSELTDVIPLMVSERLVDVNEDCMGKLIEVSGQFRSYNRHEGTKNKLVLSIFVGEWEEVEENLEKAIAAARRASMTEEDVIRLLRLLMEVNDE